MTKKKPRKTGCSSNSDPEDDEDGEAALVAVPDKSKKTLCEEHEDRVEKWRDLKIPDVALET